MMPRGRFTDRKNTPHKPGKTARYQPYEQRYCKGCEGPIIRGEHEVLYRYKKRTYCTRACFQASQVSGKVKTTRPAAYTYLRPVDRGREAELYGGVVTNAYKVGFVQRATAS